MSKRLWFVVSMHTGRSTSTLVSSWCSAVEAHHAVRLVEAEVMAKHGAGQIASTVCGEGDFEAERARAAAEAVTP